MLMAEYLASPFCIKLPMQRSFVKGKAFTPRSSHSKIVQRKHSYGSCKTVLFPMWKMCDFPAPGFSNLKVSPFSGEVALKCTCLGTLLGSDGATASDWVPIVDQVLLTASVFLTYMAGVIPGYNSSPTFQKNVYDNAVPESSNASGSATKNNDADSDYAPDALNAVKKKLLDSLEALELEDKLGNRVLEPEGYYTKRPLSLNAIADGPRLRLLCASLQRIEEEVKTISNSETFNSDYSLTDFSGVIRKSCLPVCTSWLETELDLLNCKPNKAFVLLMDAKLNGDNAILQNIRNSGKENLYAELLCFLSFGSLREGCSYNSGLFMIHGVSILEDLVITLSDGIVSIYLELISVDSNFSDEMDGVSFSLCTLSTRALQRLRNEVALYQWLYQNLEAVASMYEDRFDLWTFESQLIEKVDNSWNGNYSWWKRLIHKQSDTVSSKLDHVLINNFCMPVKRTKELRALTGWRYYYSLFLELSDISMPLVRAVIDKVSKALSFFLVCLIGRSLGLIYTGIRQSLRWK